MSRDVSVYTKYREYSLPYMTIVLCGSTPENGLESTRVLPRPLGAFPRPGARKVSTMTSQKGPIPAQSPVATLGDVLAALGTQQDLSETRRRDLRSAVNRVAALLGDAPERIPLVMPSISAKLAKLSPAAAGVSTKTFHNLRSDFLAAVKASGLHSAQRRARRP